MDKKKPLKKIAIDEVKEETGLIVIKIKKLKILLLGYWKINK